MPRFGDRLQGVLELRKQDSSERHFSPELSQAALEQIGQESERIDFKQALPKDYRKALGIFLLPLILVLIGLAVLQPKQTSSATARYLFPFADIPRYTITKFQNVPKKLYIPKEESHPFTAYLKNKEELQFIPQASLKVSGHPIESSEYNSGYHFTIPPLKKKHTLYLKAGDAYDKIQLYPTPRPRIETVSVNTVYPSYLQLPEHTTQVESQTISVLEGAQVQLDIKSSSELNTITTSSKMPFTIIGYRAKSDSQIILEPTELALSLTGSNGITSSHSTKFLLKPRKDQAPKASLNATERELIMLPHETIELYLSSQDDFGVQEMGLCWHPLDNEQDRRYTSALKGAPNAPHIETQYAFNPELLQITPNSYAVYTASKDFLTERKESLSMPITVHILSLEAHAEYLRGELSKLLDSLDETYQKELALYYENQRIENTLQEAELKTQSNSRLENSLSGEKAQIKRVSKHHEDALQLLQDTFRNDQLLHSTKRSIASLSEQLKSIAQNNLPEIRDALQSASDPKFSNEHSKNQLSHAVSLQKEALNKLQEIIESARQADRQFESSTFVQRLQELARKQDVFSQSLWKTFPNVLGEPVKDLDPALIGENENFKNIQTALGQELRWIEDDLRHFAQRAQQESFIEFADNISASGIYDKMLSTVDYLDLNHRYVATTYASQCAQELNSWGTELNTNSSSASQSGGGGGGSSEGEQDTEFMLRMMEIIRKQQDLRGRTRAIQQMKNLDGK